MATVRFNRVTTLRPWWFPIIALATIAPISAIYMTFVYANFIGLMLSCVAWFWLISIVFTLLSKPVTIAIGGAGLTLRIGCHERSYTPSEILGYYSYNDRRLSRYTTSICLYIRDGEKVDITDYSLKPASHDPTRRKSLHDFIRAMEQELGFVPIRESRLRKFLRVGYTWYESRTASQERPAGCD